MRRGKSILTVLLSATFATITQAQVSDSVFMVEALEKITEINEEEPDYQSITESLAPDRIRTIPLSRINEKSLARLGFLTAKQVKCIMDYIVINGSILSVYELRLVEELDTATIRRLLPYLVQGNADPGPPVTVGNLVHRGRHQVRLFYSQGLERKKGYITDAYAGSMARESFRYSYTFASRLKAELCGEKDAGEQFSGPGCPLGMDYYAGYLSLLNTGILKNVTIGNFTACFGQGLIAGTGSRLGSVIGFNSPLRVSQGVRGSSSAYEGSFQRGVATTLDIGRITASAFFSRHKRDAMVTEYDSSGLSAEAISSFQASGYHRTEAEIAARNRLTETYYGGNISYTGTFYRIGITGMQARWSASVEPAQKPYNLWYFRGRSQSAAGFDLIMRLRYISLFGEAGTSFNGAWAWIFGLAAEPVQSITFSITARSYDRAYVNLFSNAAGQMTRNANEQGCLINLNARVFPKLSLAAYADFFRHPWLRYRVNNPSTGLETGVLLTYSGFPGVIMTSRILYKEDEQNLASNPGSVPGAGRSSALSARFQAQWHAGDQVSLKTQFEVKSGLSGSPGPATGYLFGQEIVAGLWRSNLNLAFSYMLFDTPSWNLRIYSYEPDISGSFSVPVYDGRGIRTMIMLRGRITSHLSWWIKYGISWYDNKSSLGSGLEEISGNVRSDVKVQVVGIL